MARTPIEEQQRVAFRIRADDKATVMRAAALSRTDLTTFVLQHVLDAARTVIEESGRLELSERESLRVLDLLDSPPPPNANLVNAARAFARDSREQ